MGVHAFLRTWSAKRSDARKAPETFAGMHSADLDVHIAAVARAPSTKPPWNDSTWHRHEAARRTPPSALAQVLLDLHPAFVESHAGAAHWALIDQAEALAMEWSASWFTPHEAGEWLANWPAIFPAQARALADAGLGPADPIDLRDERPKSSASADRHLPETG